MTNPFLRVFETLFVFKKIKIDDGEEMNAGEILSALLLIIGFGLQIAGKSKEGNENP